MRDRKWVPSPTCRILKVSVPRYELTIKVLSESFEEVARRLANANPDGGTITINGQTYTWTNFEELVDIMTGAMDLVKADFMRFEFSMPQK